MKRLLPLLLCAAMLTGCGGAARETTNEIKTAEPIETSNPIETIESAPAYPARETIDYRWGDAVSITMTLPAGWAWEETAQDDGLPPTAVGVAFYPKNRPDQAHKISFQCWLQGFGMCGTGVTFTEVASQTSGELDDALDAMNRVQAMDVEEKRDVLFLMREYVQVQIPKLSACRSFREETRNRRLVMRLHYHGLSALTEKLLEMKSVVK